MAYIGTVAPFYVSRQRLKIIEGGIRGGGIKLTGSIAIPMVGELQLERSPQAATTMRSLERVVNALAGQGAIGDVWDEDCGYTWISIEARVTRVADAEALVDHVVWADSSAVTPEGWSCLLAGSRANLTSLGEPDLPGLGSSLLAVSRVLEQIKTEVVADVEPSHAMCVDLLASVAAIAGDPASYSWRVAGVVEVLKRCADDQLLVGSPLFLCSDA